MLDKLQVKMKEMNQEAERLTDTQFTKGGQDGSKDLDKAKEAIQVYIYSRLLTRQLY